MHAVYSSMIFFWPFPSSWAFGDIYVDVGRSTLEKGYSSRYVVLKYTFHENLQI